MISIHNPFDRSGLASLDDLSTPLWRSLFSRLESVQSEFLSCAPHSPDYIWPKDSLHSWSRVWEYPYAYHHLNDWLCDRTAHGRNVLDVGSGVTFFPFALERAGWRVTCTDIEASCGAAYRHASRVIRARSAIRFVQCDCTALPFEGSLFDACYCVSVLEHLHDVSKAISEIARVLRPGGLFVLTVDIDLQGNYELGPRQYKRLQAELSKHFDLLHGERSTHPAELLTTERSPFAIKAPLLLRLLRATANAIGESKHGMKLACHGSVLTRVSQPR